jgi:PAS domain S-box-containing protein
MSTSPPSKQAVLAENATLRLRLDAAQEGLAALRRQNAELRATTDNAPEIMGRVDRQFRHVFINRAIKAVTGKTVEDYLGKTNEELGHPPELCALWSATFRKVFETGQAGELEFSFPSPCGPRYFHFRAVPEFAEEGGVETVLFISTDITILKRMEAELHKAAQFPDENPYPVMRIDGAGVVLYANRACAKWFTDFSCEAGKTAPGVFATAAADALASGACREAQIEAGGRILSFLCVPISKAGYVNLYPSDITDRKRAEEALFVSRERLSLALASSGIAVFDWDIVNNTRIWDRNVHRMLGTDPETFTGTAEEFFRIVHPDDRLTMEEALSCAVKKGALEVEYRAIWPDGRIRHIASKGKVHHDSSGRPVRMTGVTWDITSRKETEGQIRRLNLELEARVIERTTELLSAVNALETEITARQRLEREILEIGEREKSRVGQDLHDGLCQELAGIAFLAKALKRNLEEDTISPEAVASKADQIANLLKEAISGARGLAARMYPVSIEDSGLAPALEKLASETAERFHIKCQFRCAAPVVLADKQVAAHVYRITQEAVSNAIRHGSAKEVNINLGLARNRITVKIEDDGDGSLKDIKATGMGLRTMNYRARSIGGELEIQQRREGGIAVVISFPNEQRIEREGLNGSHAKGRLRPPAKTQKPGRAGQRK